MACKTLPLPNAQIASQEFSRYLVASQAASAWHHSLPRNLHLKCRETTASKVDKVHKLPDTTKSSGARPQYRSNIDAMEPSSSSTPPPTTAPATTPSPPSTPTTSLNENRHTTVETTPSAEIPPVTRGFEVSSPPAGAAYRFAFFVSLRFPLRLFLCFCFCFYWFNRVFVGCGSVCRSVFFGSAWFVYFCSVVVCIGQRCR